MPQVVKHIRSAVAGKVPTTAELDLGVVAINTNDGKVFIKKDDGTPSIVEVTTPAATTSTAGKVQLEDSTSSTSTTKAATPNSVKTAYDLANAALPKAGGTLTGNVTLSNQSDLRFGEATGNGTNSVGFQAPAAISSDVTWTLPAADGSTGQVLSTNGSGILSWAAAGAAVDYQEFTSSGTWTKPAGITTVYVELVGGGGGGGSGGRYATTNFRGGGGSGAGGVFVNRWFNASDLTSTVTVTVGLGGTGGIAVTGDTAQGNNGNAGGNTSFGSYVDSGSAGGGWGGTGSSTGQAGAISYRGSSGITASTNGSATIFGGAAGGPGATRTGGTTSAAAGTTGGINRRMTTGGSATGAAAGANATANEGGGGGGGSYTTAQAGMAGGNGAFPGGGGGGGSASDNGYNSGAGGNGADGVVRVWSW